MNVLEINAEIKFTRSLPRYLPAETTLNLNRFVDGSGEPEKEFQTLREFRNALLGLIREGLSQSDNVMGLPYVGLNVTAGEHCANPIFNWHGRVEVREEDGRRFWRVTLARAKDSSDRFAALDSEAALMIFEPVLERLFSRWASQVTFEPPSRSLPS